MQSDTLLKAITILAIAGVVIAFLIQPGPTPEQIQAEAELKAAEAAIEQAEADQRAAEQAQRHQEYLEREAAKTPEEKVIEAQEQNSVDMGEAALGVVGIGAATYLFGKMLDY